jgi:hypothetical protein
MLRMPSIRPLALLCGLTLVTLTAACGDSPMSPDGVGAQQTSDAAMLAQVLAKLDSVQSQIDQQSLEIDARIDSLEAHVGLGGSGGGTVLPAAQIDSILALASFIADNASSGGWQLCGSFQLGGELGLERGGEVEGEAEGDLGAWAGTGAFAGAKIKPTLGLKGSFKGALGGGISGCIPLGGGTPPSRPAPAGPAKSADLDQLRTTLTDLANQFNLNPTSISQSIGGIGTALQSPNSLTLANMSSYVPIPSALSALTNDPMGTMSGYVQGVSNDALDALCNGGGWGSNLSSVISDACGLIPGGLPSVTALATISADFPALENTVSGVCSTINGIGLQTLAIPSYTVDFGSLIGTYTVFPGYNKRLFPNYSSLTC